MSMEFIAIISVGITIVGVGVALAGLILNGQRTQRADINSLREEVGGMREQTQAEFKGMRKK